ncbi:MAG: class I SAM-dependent rRNA methyltransferase [Oscillibacter sp.]|jgi:23S rRNA (cytosine1962-C5)-methyltransferase|nr:class I SAM-dependent rRNA methyltransferase [Oscillibacter sp.]
MKATRNYPKYTVTPKAEASVLQGHPWIYGEEVLTAEGKTENGGLVDVLNKKGRYLGTGFLSEHSKIRVRLISRNANDGFDESFWRRKLQWAWEYRKSVMAPEDLNCCRIIFGEADAFPGLTVDKFHDLLSIQVLSAGMDRIKNLLLPMLAEILRQDGYAVRGVYERNDAALRDKEGLPQYKAWLPLPGQEPPASPSVEIVENGIKYLVDVENGQKTGFFLDQKYNRRAVGRLTAGKTVLDCFTHTGSFALNAAAGGAKHVTAVDISESALEMARSNAVRNGLESRMDFLAADVFDLLPELEHSPTRYDFIILDPPAFTKSRKTVANAMSGYREINYRAMRLLPRGGYLATCSCSHFAEEDRFLSMLWSAARNAGVQLRQIEARQQSCDHPILWGVDETNYLKFYLFQVI